MSAARSALWHGAPRLTDEYSRQGGGRAGGRRPRGQGGERAGGGGESGRIADILFSLPTSSSFARAFLLGNSFTNDRRKDRSPPPPNPPSLLGHLKCFFWSNRRRFPRGLPLLSLPPSLSMRCYPFYYRCYPFDHSIIKLKKDRMGY